MLAQPPEPTSRDVSDWEKDRLAWNLPRPRPVAPPAWARIDLDPLPGEREAEQEPAADSS